MAFVSRTGSPHAAGDPYEKEASFNSQIARGETFFGPNISTQ